MILRVRPRFLIFVLFLMAYMANGRPYPEVDCVAAPYVAWSMVRHGDYQLQRYPDLEKYADHHGVIRKRDDGAWVSIRSPGSSIMALPVIAPLAMVRDKVMRSFDMHHVGKFVAACCVAGACVFFYSTCKRLTPNAAWRATILLGLGTSAYSVCSQSLWMHGPSLLWLCSALWAMTHPGISTSTWRYSSFAGFSLGMAVLARPTTGIFVITSLFCLALTRQWKALFGTMFGGVVPALILFHYNFVNFGHPMLGGYENEFWADPAPIWLGLSGLLIAPSRGLLVYSPALILALVGFYQIIIRSSNASLFRVGVRPILIAWIAGTIATLVFYARWHEWRGGWCFGPRLLSETLPVWCFGFAFACDAMRTRASRIITWSLVILSVMIHVVGVFGYRGYEDWQRRHDLHDQGRCLFELSDTQIEAHARALIGRIVPR